jgi:hypothetical protein
MAGLFLWRKLGAITIWPRIRGKGGTIGSLYAAKSLTGTLVPFTVFGRCFIHSAKQQREQL